MISIKFSMPMETEPVHYVNCIQKQNNMPWLRYLFDNCDDFDFSVSEKIYETLCKEIVLNFNMPHGKETLYRVKYGA